MSRPHLSSPNSTAASPTGLNRTRDGVAPRFEMECAQYFSEVVQVFGIPRSVGQIYGLLYASPRPLGFSDIVELLEISKGSASQGMQLLRELGAINEAQGEQQWGKLKSQRGKSGAGSPVALNAPDEADTVKNVRVLYEPELSLRRLVNGLLRERIAPMAATSTERMAKLRALAEQPAPEEKFYLARAKQLNTWRRRLKAILPVLGALLGPKHN